VDSSDHSDIEDWAPATLEEALKVLDDWLQEATIVIIIIIVVLFIVLSFTLLSGPFLSL
jgi:Tfp pilus assembly protein PilO